MTRYVNFDEAWEENKSEPVIAHAFGLDWELPASMPADVMLESIRLMKEGGESAPVDQAEMANILTRIVPKAILDKWVELGLTVDQYGVMIQKLMAMYVPGSVDAAGETPAPGIGASETLTS